MPEKHEPTPEEMAKGDEALTPTQRALSEKQAALLENKGAVVLRLDDIEPSDKDRERWKDKRLEGVLRLSIALKDGRHIELAAVARVPQANSLPAVGGDEMFAGTINGQEIPSRVARTLYEKYSDQITARPEMYYRDDYKVEKELEDLNPLWADLV